MRSSKAIVGVLSKALLALAIVIVLIPPIPAGAVHGEDHNVNSVPEMGPTAGGAIGTDAGFQRSMLNNGSLGPPGQDDFGCSLGTTFSNCIAAMMYYIGPGLASNVAYIGAYFFSIVIQLSLNSTAYALTFLSEGWQVVRDLANMAFIFILIYLSLTIMLQAETAGTIKTLAIVIVVALLVNFSFFFTRVMIDAGNILALQFYNAIPGGTVVGPDGSQQPALINGTKDLSASIMNAVQLQTLYGSKAFEEAKDSCGANSGVTCGLIVSTVVYLSVAAMFWMLFFAFLQVGIKFLLRIVALWFLLIASPLAFVAKTMKKTEGYFSKWWKMLFQFSVYPAIFLFMFLILTKFTSAVLGTSGGGSLINAAFNSTLPGSSPSSGIMATIAAISIRMGFVLALLYIALRVSDWIVKEGSETASSITGWTLGKTFGATAAGGRLTFGWAAQRANESAWLRDKASKGGLLGRTLWRGTSTLGKSNFDLRGAPGVRTGIKKMTGGDVGGATQKGGYLAERTARTEWREKEAKALKPNDAQQNAAIKEAIDKLDPDKRKAVINAAEHFRKIQKDKEEGAAGPNEVKKARANYSQVLRESGLNKLIDEAKAARGSKNDQKYADAITTRNWRNLWGTTNGIPGFIGSADKEAARRLRGNKSDADQIKNILANLGEKPDDNYDPEGDGGGGGKGGGGSPSTGGGPDSGGASGGGAAAGTAAKASTATAAGRSSGGASASFLAPVTSSTVTARLSDEDRALFKKVIRGIQSSGETTSQGLANIAGRISDASHPSDTAQNASNDNAPTAGSAPKTANDNVAKRIAANDNAPRAAADAASSSPEEKEPFPIDLDDFGQKAA